MQFIKKEKPSSTERKKEIKKTGKEANRTIDRGKRDVNKEIRELDRQETDITCRLKKAHKKGNESEVKSLALQVAQIRKTRQRLQETNNQLTSIKTRNTSIVSSSIAAETMGVAAKAMGTVSQSVGSGKELSQMMNEYSREKERMQVREETWDELMDDFEGEDINNEAEAVFNQVMDEAGLHATASMGSVPVSQPFDSSKKTEIKNSEDEKIEEEMERLLAGLQA